MTERKKLNILLHDVDRTKFPNLALMKISAYHKEKGDEVFLNHFDGRPDKVYISVVFSWNKEKALNLKYRYKMFGIETVCGGFPIGNESLCNKIEHMMPDYSLYNLNYSMGFTSRGCIRRCPFCLVREKEGRIRYVASIKEFLHPYHRELLLLDNNLLASPRAEFTLRELRQAGVEVDFNQGLDIRLVNNDNAELLKRVNLKRFLRFALDSNDYIDEFNRGMSIIKEKGFDMSEVMIYVLVGYDTTFHEDMERFKAIAKFGSIAFPMVYRPCRKEDKKGVVPTDGNLDKLKKASSRMPFRSYMKLSKFYGLFEDRYIPKRGIRHPVDEDQSTLRLFEDD